MSSDDVGKDAHTSKEAYYAQYKHPSHDAPIVICLDTNVYRKLGFGTSDRESAHATARLRTCALTRRTPPPCRIDSRARRHPLAPLRESVRDCDALPRDSPTTEWPGAFNHPSAATMLNQHPADRF